MKYIVAQSPPRLAISGLIALLFALIVLPGSLFAAKKVLRPYHGQLELRKHPYSDQLAKASAPDLAVRKDANYQKLLVILVDFAEELPDDPLTTGNGKFQLSPDPEYLYSIGAPPHDRAYFEANLQAMNYYYKAVSAGDYDLSYDVWPKDKAAYSLPNTLAYYNPPGANSELFVQKMEEYFKAAFETADAEDPEIDFSAYGHYMIIHAGSDWQHDYFGDTPSDLPSFFIRVGDGKHAVVDEGTHNIYSACNVPATISQDFSVSEEDGYSVHSGYGALNSVLFHEFGHTLGLVDLYNVYSFIPMVGAFDIMDSGGSGIMVDELENGDLIMVEGVLPALPGAFSRALLFEDIFREKGLMQDISSLEPNHNSLLAASSMRQEANPKPSIVKIRINPDEYYLLENRSVDPDGDGGTAVFASEDDRVILYPTGINDPGNVPTYEYDYLLPSFVKANGAAVGGGILAWYVNERILYQEGQILDDGSLWTNFENNTINTNFLNPGVRVLEADGLQDIGEMHSSYWTGTPYEYFHARKPVLDTQGQFVQWSQESWRPALGSQTDPAMLDSQGLGSVFYLDDISDPAALMSYTIKGDFFTELYSDYLGYQGIPVPPVNTNYSELSLPFYGAGGITLYSHLGYQWEDLMGPADLAHYPFDHPLVVCDVNEDSYSDIVGVDANTMHFMSFAQSPIDPNLLSFPDILEQPLVHDSKLYVHSANAVYRVRNYDIDDYYSTSDIRGIVLWNDKLAVQKANALLILNNTDFSEVSDITLPEEFGDYDPLAWSGLEGYLLFLTANSGNIYSYDGQILKKIFSNPEPTMPSQPALSQHDDDILRVFFGLGNRAYVLSYNGALQAGFPLYLNDVQIDPDGYARAMWLNNELILHLPVGQQGYIAISVDGALRPQYSLMYPISENAALAYRRDYLQYAPNMNMLLWYFALDSRIYINQLAVTQDPILWNGRHNGGSGSISGSHLQDPDQEHVAFDAYVYPSPVNGGIFRLRVLGTDAAVSINVYDISGSKILSMNRETNATTEEFELDSSGLASGVYIVRVKSGKHNKTFKFAIEK